MPTLHIENAESDIVEAYNKAPLEFKRACYEAVKKTLQVEKTDQRPFGLGKGDFVVSDSFFDPLPEEVLNDFEGKA